MFHVLQGLSILICLCCSILSLDRVSCVLRWIDQFRIGCCKFVSILVCLLCWFLVLIYFLFLSLCCQLEGSNPSSFVLLLCLKPDG